MAAMRCERCERRWPAGQMWRAYDGWLRRRGSQVFLADCDEAWRVCTPCALAQIATRGLFTATLTDRDLPPAEVWVTRPQANLAGFAGRTDLDPDTWDAPGTAWLRPRRAA